MTNWVSQAGTAFRSVDWFVPPYMQGGVIRKLAAEIDAAPADKKHAVLELGLRRFYGPGYLAAMFLERYRKVDPVRDFAVQIREAMEEWAFGLDHAAVATLLPVLEGVIRRLALADGRDVGSGTKKLVNEIEELADRRALAQAQGQPTPGLSDALVERVEMLDQLRTFLGRASVGRDGEVHRHQQPESARDPARYLRRLWCRGELPEAGLISRRPRLLHLARDLGHFVPRQVHAHAL
jgi:hypothetical protein